MMTKGEMSMMRLVLFAALLSIGCGDDSQSRDLSVADLAATADLARVVDLAGLDLTGDDFTTPVDLARSPTYPAGPYGNTVGAIIPPLVWEGYADPLADTIATAKTYGSYSMNDLRLGGSKYGIVHLSDFG
jgi:hypothetical protein